ncbi:MAG: helicase-related protein, partial [Candidatus Thermoplasmatota archaeon]|nr:helicase-related protein [Candidatus Thermoplasmatota archaeon]
EMARHERRTLLIVDECHRAGAPQYSKALVPAFPYRLGLTATPERSFDPTGTRRVMAYFGGVAHRYDLGEAVQDGHLAQYTYHLHSTYLNDVEQEAYDELTDAITFVMADIQWRFEDPPKLTELGHLLAFLRAEGGDELADELQDLLFRRARIVKNAAGKERVFDDLCQRLDEKKTIVFGEEIAFAERLAQIAEDAGLPTYIYHSKLPDQEREATLAAYRSTERGVLFAVRALDEGLDVPDADVAVLAASSTSERQHIQRRGRVLRPLHDRRKLAELHDFYVVGVDDAWRVERIREDADRVIYHGFEYADPPEPPAPVASTPP